MLEIDDQIIEKTPYIGIGVRGLSFAAIFYPNSIDDIEDEDGFVFGISIFDGFNSVEELEEYRKTVSNVNISEPTRRADIIMFKDLFSLDVLINELTILRDSVQKIVDGIQSNA